MAECLIDWYNYLGQVKAAQLHHLVLILATLTADLDICTLNTTYNS